MSAMADAGRAPARVRAGRGARRRAAVDALAQARDRARRSTGTPRGHASTRAARRTGPTGSSTPSRDLVLRRPPAGTKAKSAHDMGREYRIQQALKPVYPCVPAMIGALRGRGGARRAVLRDGAHRRAHPARARCRAGSRSTPAHARALCLERRRQAGRAAPGRRRAGGPRARSARARATRGARSRAGRDRYEKARTWNVPQLPLRARLARARTRPTTSATCVIHNDFRLDNVVLDPDDPTRVVGVLDWEMATLGDPLMDLGTALAYWVEAGDDFDRRAQLRRQPTHLPGMLTRARGRRALPRARRGLPPSRLGLLRGLRPVPPGRDRAADLLPLPPRQTRNPAFSNFWILVDYFDWRCRRVMARAGG